MRDALGVSIGTTNLVTVRSAGPPIRLAYAIRRTIVATNTEQSVVSPPAQAISAQQTHNSTLRGVVTASTGVLIARVTRVLAQPPAHLPATAGQS